MATVLWSGGNLLFWSLRHEDAVRACLRRAGGSDRVDGLDGVFRDNRLSWGGLERSTAMDSSGSSL
jgi:hypothetical protein